MKALFLHRFTGTEMENPVCNYGPYLYLMIMKPLFLIGGFARLWGGCVSLFVTVVG